MYVVIAAALLLSGDLMDTIKDGASCKLYKFMIGKLCSSMIACMFLVADKKWQLTKGVLSLFDQRIFRRDHQDLL